MLKKRAFKKRAKEAQEGGKGKNKKHYESPGNKTPKKMGVGEG